MLGAAKNYRGTSSRVDPLMCFVIVLFRTTFRLGVIIRIRTIAYTYIMHACCRIAWRAARAWSRALLVRSGPSNNYTLLLLQAAMSSQLVPVGNDPGKSWKYPAVSGSGEPQCEYCGYIKGCVCFETNPQPKVSLSKNSAIAHSKSNIVFCSSCFVAIANT